MSKQTSTLTEENNKTWTIRFLLALLLIAAGVILLGLIVYLVFRKHIYGTK